MNKYILILAVCFMISCKSRHVEKSSEKAVVETASERDEATTVTDRTTESVTVKSVIDLTNVRLIPVNANEPIVLKDSQGKEVAITNAIVEAVKSNTNTTTTGNKKNDITTATKKSGSDVVKSTKEAQGKKVKSEPVSLWSYWWVLLILLLVLVARFLYKRFKGTLNPF